MTPGQSHVAQLLFGQLTDAEFVELCANELRKRGLEGVVYGFDSELKQAWAGIVSNAGQVKLAIPDRLRAFADQAERECPQSEQVSETNLIAGIMRSVKGGSA